MNKQSHVDYGSADEFATSFNTNLNSGLTNDECLTRLKIHGYNEFNCDDEQSIFSKYFEQFKNPLIQLLLGSVVVSVIMGQWDDAVSIALVSYQYIISTNNYAKLLFFFASL